MSNHGNHKETEHGPATHAQSNARADSKSARNARNVLIAVLVIVAFFAAYRFALASWASPTASAASGGASGACCATGAATSGGAAKTPASAGSCCSSKTSAAGGSCCAADAPSTSGANAPGAAAESSGVQRISVEVSGGYNPSTIELKAGIPAEITFGQSSGCTAAVQSRDLGFQEDLTSGPKIVKLPALKVGTYGFACGMDMVQGQIVVK